MIHTPAHACRRNTRLSHQSPQKQTLLLLDMENSLGFHRQTCTYFTTFSSSCLFTYTTITNSLTQTHINIWNTPGSRLENTHTSSHTHTSPINTHIKRKTFSLCSLLCTALNIFFSMLPPLHSTEHSPVTNQKWQNSLCTLYNTEQFQKLVLWGGGGGGDFLKQNIYLIQICQLQLIMLFSWQMLTYLYREVCFFF